MYNFVETKDNPSRRGVIKSILGATIASVFFSSPSNAQRHGKASGSSSKPQARKIKRPTRLACEPAGSPEPHEPPIGLNGGSLTLDIPNSNKIVFSGPMPNDPRPYKQVLGTATYTGIEEDRVLTRPRSQRPFFNRYQLPFNPRYQLRIWLVNLKNDSGNDEDLYESLGAESSLLLRLDPPQIETEEKLKELGKSHKHSVPLRYEYPRPKHFHIGKWQITDNTGKVVTDILGNRFEGIGDDSYDLFVSFYHTP